MIYIHKWDKFGGRVVADIKLTEVENNYLDKAKTFITKIFGANSQNETNEELLSEHLINIGFAKYYSGKNKKEKWTKQELQKIIKSAKTNS